MSYIRFCTSRPYRNIYIMYNNNMRSLHARVRYVTDIIFTGDDYYTFVVIPTIFLDRI